MAAARIIVLGEGGVSFPAQGGPPVREEPGGLGLRGIEPLFEPRPDVAVVTGEGEACFFRASLAMERGTPRVVVRRGALPAAWIDDLASRAAELGSELYVRGDDGRSARRTAGPRGGEIGAPDVAAWARALDDARGSAEQTAAIGLSLDDATRARLAGSPPLAIDDAASNLPNRLEDVAFTAGLKPVLYLVLPRSQAGGLAARYGGAHVAMREATVAVDAATGRRAYEQGEPSVHAFIGRDADAAERALALWSDGSSRHVRELGALMGYPACCVASFAALASRSHNAALVYVTASRTRALGAGLAPVLDVVVRRIVPFTPCTFACERAVAWAEGVLAALPEAAASSLRRALARPVLYLDEAQAIVLDADGPAGGDATRFTRARWVRGAADPEGPAMLHARRLWAGALGAGGSLRVLDDAFVVTRDDGEVVRLARGSPRLGALLDFRAPR